MSVDDPNSIFNLTDDALVSKGIIRMRDVIPKAFWVALAVGDVGGGAAIGWLLHGQPVVILLCALLGYIGVIVAFQIVAVRLLFMLNRAQLELRILATSLPSEAASLVAKHMRPPGL